MYDSCRAIRNVGLAGGALLGISTCLAAPPVGAGNDCTPSDSAAPICLSGTVVTPDYDAALIRRAGQSALFRVRPGDAVDTWRVGEIGPGFVVLARDGKTLRVVLGPDAGAGPVETAAAPTPAAPARAAVKRGLLARPRVLNARGEREDPSP